MKSRRIQRVVSQVNDSHFKGQRKIEVVPKEESSIRKVVKENSFSKICIIRSLGGIGDVLMTTPALRELKQRYPNIQITYAIDRHKTFDDAYYSLIKNAPFIDFIVDVRYVNRSSFDKVVDITATGLSYERQDLPPRNRIDMFGSALGLNRLSDYLPFYKTESDEILWARKLINRTYAPVIALHTASNEEKRSLPIEKYREIILKLNQRLSGIKILLFDFNNRNVELANLPGVLSCNLYKIREVAALIEQCDVFMGPDSGLMHLSAALKVPSVVVFGSIPPIARINHYPTHISIQENISCKNCWYSSCNHNIECMKKISSENIVDKIISQISSASNKICFHSILDPCDGYGGSAEQIALALSQKDPHIKYLPHRIAPDWKRLVEPHVEGLCNRSGDALAYLGYYPPGLNERLSVEALRARKRFIYTTFESTKPPAQWTDYINQFDKLFVSCRMCKEAFQEAGVEVPISIVPLGIKEKNWPYLNRSTTGPFRFLMFANAKMDDSRKNYLAGYKAFKKAFGNNKNVELILKVSGGEIPREIAAQPNVKIFSGRYAHDELLDIFRLGDALISPSKGEGYGLVQREAMATGMPVVSVNWGGVESIMNLEYNYPVRFKLEPAVYLKGLYEERNNGSSDFGFWANPITEHIAEVISQIPGQFSTVRERGSLASEWIRQNETYSITSQKLIEEMGL